MFKLFLCLGFLFAHGISFAGAKGEQAQVLQTKPEVSGKGLSAKEIMEVIR